MDNPDLILITQSESVEYIEFSHLPRERMELYADLVFPRMVHYRGKLHSHIDLLNCVRDGLSFQDAGYGQRRKMLSIWNLPGYSGLHIAAYLTAAGFRVKVINNFDAEWDLFQGAYGSAVRPPLIGISTTFYLSFRQVRRITEKIRESYPDARILLGGAFVNAQMLSGDESGMEKTMRRFGINYVLHGFNSEADLQQLVGALKDNRGCQSVPGLLGIEEGGAAGRFFSTPSRWNEPVLDGLEPCWDRIEAPFIHRTMPFRTSAGCPYACAFCSYPVTARGFRTMSLESVKRHLLSIQGIPGVDTLIFLDDTLNASPQRFKELCRLLCSFRFQWFSFLRAQTLDEETVSLMKDSGCKGVYLGVESANDAILANMNKRATSDQFRRGIGLLARSGITTVGAFIIGFPGETDRTIEENVSFIENTGLTYYTLKEFYYMKHTPVHRMSAQYGLEGEGNNWKHGTMDYRTAAAKKREMFSRIRGCVFVDADTNLWHIAYLADQGFSPSGIRSLQEATNSIVSAQLQGDIGDEHPGFLRLAEAVRKGRCERGAGSAA
ncbi:MAG TPA: radical SAM protein [Candidatus Omnitrophota bacterium]|nr:radical SAM protein [Candidatus Omnitrophota bacterium]HRZ15295.1 radical SAM protein [Candidatus Omnitrophota bacterium]